MSSRDTVGIVGAGRFGTALASVVARAGRPVLLWSRNADVVAEIRRDRRSRRLPDAPLPPPADATSDPAQLARTCRFIVLAVASTDIRARARELGEVIDGSHLVVHAIGGLAAPGDDRPSEVIAAATPALRIGALAGPALPGDMASAQFASMVVASRFAEVVSEARRLLNTPPLLRVYGSSDLAGVELSAALAGAYTVALGLCDGVGIGPGARAVLLTRAVAEGGRLIEAAGGEGKTMSGLAGLGNLLVRSTPASSARDYALGQTLASGVCPKEEDFTEGARAAVAGARLARRLGVRMPVLDGVAAVITGQTSVADAARLAADTVASEE